MAWELSAYLIFLFCAAHKISTANPSPPPWHVISFLHRYVTRYTCVHSVFPSYNQAQRNDDDDEKYRNSIKIYNMVSVWFT